MSTRGWNITNFVIAFIALILVIIIYFVVYDHRNEFKNKGIEWIVQQGVSSGKTDIMTTGGHNLYLAQNKSDLVLTVNSSSNNKIGTTISVKNMNTVKGQNVVLKAGSGVSLSEGGIVNGLVLSPAEYAIFTVTTGTTFTRL